MSIDRRSVRLSGTEEIRHFTRSALLGAGTLACPRCDVPVALATGRASPAEPLGCPFCGHAGAVRDFLSLATPSRPAHVEVTVTMSRSSAGRGRLGRL